MTVETFWHVGILVFDLDAAIGRFSKLLGVTFNRLSADVDVVGHSEGQGSLHLDAAFSAEGPPFYELMQAHEDGIWGRQQGEGVHHVALWEPDINRRFAKLRELGAVEELLLSFPDSRLLAYLTPASAHGVRMEFVDERFKPDFGY